MIVLIPFAVRVNMFRTDYAGAQRGFNLLVRRTLLEIGLYWVEHFLPEHFKRTAVARYSYPRSTDRWLQFKKRIKNETRPLVYTGELLEQVETQNYKPRATATAKRQTVRVTVPIPHPLNQSWSGTIGKLLQYEANEMHRYGIERMSKRIYGVMRAPRARRVGRKAA